SIEPVTESGGEGKTLYIKLRSEETDRLEEVYRLLWSMKGEMTVKLCFEDTRKTCRPKGIYGVKNAKDLINKLEEICGKGNIMIK
ncbi:MAG: hypothetical protein K2K41_01990, partial [Ruminiclostridium sp.]|nr:hypothetical protein [Ruminiclostridium sp.]